jgi:hypothetical protein
MEWIDIACIVFVCVTMNHLGLVGAVEKVLGFPLPIVNCVKCLTFWCVLAYGIARSHDATALLAISFLASYASLWLELLEGYVDTFFMKFYEKIYPDPDDDTVAADAERGDPPGPVS